MNNNHVGLGFMHIACGPSSRRFSKRRRDTAYYKFNRIGAVCKVPALTEHHRH